MREKFKDMKLRSSSVAIVDKANEIIDDYREQGFTLTLRQLYYQFVSRALIENTQKSYKNLGNVISDGRLAGLIDWSAIEDRTRFLRELSHWDSPAQIARTCVNGFYKDHWENQDYRVEVWVEKDALAGIAEAACNPLDVSFFCCKGYTSQSEMYSASKRIIEAHENGKTPVIIHLGDHDPSGIDMSRDIQDRLAMFTESHGVEIDFTRIALNYDQVRKYKPPHNPTKLTDSRSAVYKKKFGMQSWELDALEPKVLVSLIQSKINEYRDLDRWEEIEEEQEKGRKRLAVMAKKLED